MFRYMLREKSQMRPGVICTYMTWLESGWRGLNWCGFGPEWCLLGFFVVTCFVSVELRGAQDCSAQSGDVKVSASPQIYDAMEEAMSPSELLFHEMRDSIIHSFILGFNPVRQAKDAADFGFRIHLLRATRSSSQPPKLAFAGVSCIIWRAFCSTRFFSSFSLFF